MPVDLIQVIRELTDQGTRKQSTDKHFFYKDVSDYCSREWEPNTDIYESQTHIIILLELAGATRDKISVKVKNGKLLISGERSCIETKEKLAVHQMEIIRGEFFKQIQLPPAFEHNEITAKLVNGLLEIQISKENQAIEIPISVEAEKQKLHE